MSIVWAFVKEDKGYVFSDGLVIPNDPNKNKQEDFDKTFKTQNANNEYFIGGITGNIVSEYQSNPPVGVKGSQKAEFKFINLQELMKNFIITSQVTNDELLSKEIKSFFDPHVKYLRATDDNGEPNSTHFLIITPWKSLFKISIMYNLNNLSVDSLDYKNESIGDGGDEGSYNPRTIFFNGIYCIKNTNFKDYKNLFRIVKRHICGDTVGGKTFHQTLP